ncbi:ABC transporter ATP-binding protein [Merismopedia glauca]|uniref:ABC transporter ATP-binding protein n=1 Tax=Merismopedia glauca CCAP 1448/3 TaxID=1296344 RepID=A0A2T1BXS3_9CYAN|nr:ABC transporter ATP-binding protein [Merismopedia glauca]PSB00810.1 ABC transporter ATP-binding protein [Merismopedia glauca CCAP 1448/3]
MPILEAEQVSMKFGGLVAVDRVNFNVEKGDITSIIGPNGAGKTTFFNMLTGIYTPTVGRIIFNLQDITGLSPDRLTKLGIARTFQNLRLFGNMSVIDNVLVGRHCRLKTGLIGALLRSVSVKQEENKAKQKALELLNYVGLGSFKAYGVAKNLSYGDQRRLEIARALASDPQLLLLDEPTAGMNPKETAALTELIQRIRQELDLTILLIEHDMKVVMGISDRVMVMRDGVKIAEDSPQNVRSNPEVIEAYLGKEED